MKTIKNENVRVEISSQPKFFGVRSFEDEMQICEQIRVEILRHVDNIGTIDVVYDEVASCEHCGRTWTESSNKFNGGCCDKDMDEEDARTIKTMDTALIIKEGN